jgi:hypothetical protein
MPHIIENAVKELIEKLLNFVDLINVVSCRQHQVNKDVTGAKRVSKNLFAVNQIIK